MHQSKLRDLTLPMTESVPRHLGEGEEFGSHSSAGQINPHSSASTLQLPVMGRSVGLEGIEIQVQRFREDRKWGPFHTIRNRVFALQAELG